MSAESPPPAGLALRVQQAALLLNGATAAIVGTGFIVGYIPHATAQPIMARKAAACFYAAAVLLTFVAANVRRYPLLMVPALAFVSCNLADSVYEWAVLGDKEYLPPTVIEAVLLAVYLATIYSSRRGRRR
ncbi:MAG TPA: hypothetical protein VMZ28_12390 [Kofleriaceae bacterium]|nr:hypothetical protein [Kofleriaceae bacterium]